MPASALVAKPEPDEMHVARKASFVCNYVLLLPSNSVLVKIINPELYRRSHVLYSTNGI